MPLEKKITTYRGAQLKKDIIAYSKGACNEVTGSKHYIEFNKKIFPRWKRPGKKKS